MAKQSARNHSVLVKICGLQHVSTLESMRDLPIDYIGFVFAKSKRQVTPRLAGDMIDYLRNNFVSTMPLSVGVFVNPTWEELLKTLEFANLEVIQLHGQETPDLCRRIRTELKLQVFKVFSISEDISGQDPQEILEPYRDSVDGVLLDTYDPAVGGGTGNTFSWERLTAFMNWTSLMEIPLFVAGGLKPDNVAQLIQEYMPDGVDVSSGVETEGMKDINKIIAFVERVKS